MKQVINLIGLKREAMLLDSGLYILKAMAAISVGFILGQAFSITRLDMISVLLGVMYNLEPINVSGVRGGLNQLLASTLGALCTGMLVYLMGYNVTFLTVALGIGLTIYIALKIDYRMVSPVAIFTSIYMTQLLQKDVLGNPSVFLTFRLRIAALGLGVLVALLFNFLFSVFYYRSIGKKRLEFVKVQGLSGLIITRDILSHTNVKEDYQLIMAAIFSDIEMVKANIEMMMKEKFVPFNKKEKENLIILYSIVKQIKTINHLAYDCIYIEEAYGAQFNDKQKEVFDRMIEILQNIDFTHKNTYSEVINRIEIEDDQQTEPSRLDDNTKLIVQQFNELLIVSKDIE